MAELSAARRSLPDSGQADDRRLLILGLGNPMMADDGIGHAVVRRLESRNLPDRVRLVAIDGDVLALTRLWRGEGAVWLADAIISDRFPGAARVYEHRELFELPPGGLSVHHPNIGEGLRWMLHARPEMAAISFRLFGIEAGVVRSERRLSPAVNSAVGLLVDQIEGAAREWTASSTGRPSPARDPGDAPTSS